MEETYRIGIDVGSTTSKIVVLDSDDNAIYSDYKRHNADQKKSVIRLFRELAEELGDIKGKITFTGSGAKPIADALGVTFVQEVVANSIAIKKRYTYAGCAIELGGQDAKIIFFKKKESDDSLNVSDMRMNGSCAGGTGAFIDEVASILKVKSENFNELASKGNCVYDISGRCGVYAKTDIQPLLNQGIAKEDLALSTFHAIAKQTIGGLAQGLDIKPPVIFEGGPLTFNPRLVEVFSERLGLSEDQIIIPAHPEKIIAYGAAQANSELYFDTENEKSVVEVADYLSNMSSSIYDEGDKSELFFESEEEYLSFKKRHCPAEIKTRDFKDGETLEVYLGIDSGSTTTKFVIMDDEENIIDSFYAPNEGDPLYVAKDALIALREKYKSKKVNLKIKAAGTTGYGEMLFAKAFKTESHVVETVAHAVAASKYVKHPSFILDIGGQDMKAIWLDNGIVTNIVVNEACSSGCGSFLANFASNLGIPVEKIAESAFGSKNPAKLGSRCTVFMNSSIITEQRNGKNPDDIMAGLCRSIIENVFTKVIRVSNLESLGDRIVVQGGTFKNDAVLRAMEQYIGKEIIRAPHAGIMGAIGAALVAKKNCMNDAKFQSTFIGLENLEYFTYKQEANLVCPFCANHCKRTRVVFSTGDSWITNNRCERGEIVGDPKNDEIKAKLKEKLADRDKIPNMFKTRKELLFKAYPYEKLCEKRNVRIGIPRVLFFWESMPFWGSFLGSLGFDVVVSPYSTRNIYENGLAQVASDTVCFPAKLVHGHLRELAKLKVDRIFMPAITTMPSENNESTSISRCGLVKGYPLVIKNSDNPKRNFDIPFDAPLFHWFSVKDRDRQLKVYMKETFGIDESLTGKAIEQGEKAQKSFKSELVRRGNEIRKNAKEQGKFAVILASRPYQNDPLVNHDLPEMFTELGIPVLTVDSLDGIENIDLSKSRIDIVNNYHARMLQSAVLAAENEDLEYVQIVSFGCGHDAYLSDEIIRMMNEISKKSPLVLKLDESDIQGPLRIRVRSFIETVKLRIEKQQAKGGQKVEKLEDPYPVKFTKNDVKEKTVLVPNTSHAFCRIMSAALKGQHIKAVPLDIGRENAIKLGKKYVHNDICFPAQIVIGEILAALESNKYDNDNVAVAMAKYVGCCRLTHYGALLRKALDDAGYKNVPILTNDDVDYHNMHPGFKMNFYSSIKLAFMLPMIDAYEEILRKIRPYEIIEGSSDEAFEKAMDYLIDGMEKSGIHGAFKGFAKGIKTFGTVKYDRSVKKPKVLIVGEYLLNFHPGANHDIEAYLEKNGFEIIEAKMTDVIQKTYFYQDSQIREYKVDRPTGLKIWMRTADAFFDIAHSLTDRIAKRNSLYKGSKKLKEMAEYSDPVIPHTYDSGEGILIPAEIIHHAKEGCKAFVILQPFGCLPNHVIGRGIGKKLKEMFPDVSLLPLDYDPDVSFANVENRLQMLIMNVKNSGVNQ